MTIAALVTELQDAQPFLQFVADVFGGAQGADHDSAADSGRAALGAVAEENEQAARERARTTHKTALAAALGAAETCTAGVTNPMTNSERLAWQSPSAVSSKGLAPSCLGSIPGSLIRMTRESLAKTLDVHKGQCEADDTCKSHIMPFF
jgi:hypothetical protein